MGRASVEPMVVLLLLLLLLSFCVFFNLKRISKYFPTRQKTENLSRCPFWEQHRRPDLAIFYITIIGQRQEPFCPLSPWTQWVKLPMRHVQMHGKMNMEVKMPPFASSTELIFGFVFIKDTIWRFYIIPFGKIIADVSCQFLVGHGGNKISLA